MKPQIIKFQNIDEKDFGVLKVKQLFNTEEMENMSAAVIKIDGENKIASTSLLTQCIMYLKAQVRL